VINDNHVVLSDIFHLHPNQQIVLDANTLEHCRVRRYPSDAYGVGLLDFLAEEVANRIRIETEVRC
jgi:hypothetical protein